MRKLISGLPAERDEPEQPTPPGKTPEKKQRINAVDITKSSERMLRAFCIVGGMLS